MGSLARINTWACTIIVPFSSRALKVIQPANTWPCGVIRVKDSSSAYSTSTPVESLMPPVKVRLSRATSPGAMPVRGPKKRFPLGQNSGNRSFQVLMTSFALNEVPFRVMLYVFCHILPKPCRGPFTSFPSRFKFNAPLGTLETLSPVIQLGRLAASPACLSDCPSVGAGEVDMIGSPCLRLERW